MLETVRMIVVLTVISGLSSLGLAAFNQHAKPFIVKNERLFTLRSIKKVMPDTKDPDPCETVKPKFENSPDQDAVCIDGMTVYRGSKDGQLVGLAVVTVGEKAYSGTIGSLIGISLDGMVTGVEILKHAETPGLGAKIESCTWRKQFVGKSASDMVWKVEKDGGDVDQISGATISSRSVLNAIGKAQKLVGAKGDTITNAQSMEPGEVCHAR
jgi:electron transport complex protein RnfG